MTHPIKLLNKFSQYLLHFNQGQVMESLALARYYNIYKEIQPNDIPTEEVNNYGILSYVDDKDFLTPLGGNDYYFMKKGYLKEYDNLVDCFYRYKLAHHYSDMIIKECPKPNQTKQKIIDISISLIRTINSIKNGQQLIENPINNTKVININKYNEYVQFTIKHILNYCSQYDKDFKIIGNQLFHDFEITQNKQNIKVFNAIVFFVNQHLDRYQKVKKESGLEHYSGTILIVDEKIQHIFNYLENKEKLDVQIIKIALNSYDKGKLGEELFGEFIQGEVIGYQNNKTDVIDENSNISLKTSYTNTWNNHLSYLNENKETIALLNAINNKIPLYTLKEINWFNIIQHFICGEETIHELAFQKIILDESENNPIDIKVWRLKTDKIMELVKEKQFIFQNNNIILFHNQDQVLKFNIKKRTDKIQVMVITDENSLNNAIAHSLGDYSRPLTLKVENKIKI